MRYNGSVARLNFGPVTASKVGRWLDAGAFDVLHLHEPVTPSVSVIALSACEGPIVATFHTSMIRSRTMQTAYPILRSNLEKIDARIAVSEDARRTVTTHVGGDAIVIPNGVYVDRFASARRNPAWTGTPSRPTIAFLGRMGEPRKGLPVLAAALPEVLARVPGLRVLLAGPGDVREITAGLPPEVARACEFLGPVSDEDKASLLASVDVYVAPNTGGESFGIILIEAMSRRRLRPRERPRRLLPGPRRWERRRDVPQRGPRRPRRRAARACSPTRPAGRRPSPPRGASGRGSSTGRSSPPSIIAVYETVIEGRMAARAEPQTGWNRFLAERHRPMTDVPSPGSSRSSSSSSSSAGTSATARLASTGSTSASAAPRRRSTPSWSARAEAALELANSGLLDGATSLHPRARRHRVARDARRARRGAGDDREPADRGARGHPHRARPRCHRAMRDGPSPADEPLARLGSACTRVQLSRRFHNDAVTDVRRVRRKWVVRVFHLAGHTPLPSTIEFDDDAPPALVP